MATYIIALALSLSAVSPSPISANPEDVVREFLRAAYSHDAARFNALIVPPSGAGVLLGRESVPKERLAEIEAKANRSSFAVSSLFGGSDWRLRLERTATIPMAPRLATRRRSMARAQS